MCIPIVNWSGEAIPHGVEQFGSAVQRHDRPQVMAAAFGDAAHLLDQVGGIAIDHWEEALSLLVDRPLAQARGTEHDHVGADRMAYALSLARSEVISARIRRTLADDDGNGVAHACPPPIVPP